MVLCRVPGSVHSKFIYYMKYIMSPNDSIWMTVLGPRGQERSEMLVGRPWVKIQSTASHASLPVGEYVRMKMMTRRSQSIWRIDLICITKKRHGTKTNHHSCAPECDRMYVCHLFVQEIQDGLICMPNTPSTDIQTSRRADGEGLLWWLSPLPQWWSNAMILRHVSRVTFPSSCCQVQGWEGLSEQSCEQGIKNKSIIYIYIYIVYIHTYTYQMNNIYIYTCTYICSVSKYFVFKILLYLSIKHTLATSFTLQFS